MPHPRPKKLILTIMEKVPPDGQSHGLDLDVQNNNKLVYSFSETRPTNGIPTILGFNPHYFQVSFFVPKNGFPVVQR